jgi:hypothetical protein
MIQISGSLAAGLRVITGATTRTEDSMPLTPESLATGHFANRSMPLTPMSLNRKHPASCQQTMYPPGRSALDPDEPATPNGVGGPGTANNSTFGCLPMPHAIGMNLGLNTQHPGFLEGGSGELVNSGGMNFNPLFEDATKAQIAAGQGESAQHTPHSTLHTAHSTQHTPHSSLRHLPMRVHLTEGSMPASPSCSKLDAGWLQCMV